MLNDRFQKWNCFNWVILKKKRHVIRFIFKLNAQYGKPLIGKSFTHLHRWLWRKITARITVRIFRLGASYHRYIKCLLRRDEQPVDRLVVHPSHLGGCYYYYFFISEYYTVINITLRVYHLGRFNCTLKKIKKYYTEQYWRRLQTKCRRVEPSAVGVINYQNNSRAHVIKTALKRRQRGDTPAD